MSDPVSDDQAVLDADALARLRRIGGGKLLERMMDLFLTHGPERIAALTDGAAAGDTDAVERAAHTMKSSAGNLGAAALQAICQQLETDAAAGNINAAHVARAVACYDATVAAVKRVQEEIGK